MGDKEKSPASAQSCALAGGLIIGYIGILFGGSGHGFQFLFPKLCYFIYHAVIQQPYP
jgi:hypothetical protein